MAYDLTKEFIETLVNQPIVSFEVNAGSKQGDNVQGVLKAVTVETAAGETLNLVHKTMSADPAARYFIVDAQTFRIETEFYTKIAPAIEAVVKSRSPANYQLPIPKFYAGFNNDNDDYLTMDDLRPQGYRMADKFVGLNFNEVSVFLKALGRFHAFSYFFLKQEGEKLFDTVLPRISRPFFDEPGKTEEFAMMFGGATDYTVEIASKKFPEIEESLRSKLKRDTHGFQTSQKTDSKFFPLLIHADLWVNNMMFKYDQEGKAVDVKFIDFQLTRRGNIFEELLYFFFTSTTPEFRRNYLYSALEVYYQSFTSNLKNLQCPLPIGFTRGFLIDSFNECILDTYAFMGFAIPMQLGENPGIVKSDDFEKPPEGHGGPPQGDGAPPAFNMADIPVEIRTAAFVNSNRAQLENSPKALQRFYDITEEMIQLKLL